MAKQKVRGIGVNDIRGVSTTEMYKVWASILDAVVGKRNSENPSSADLIYTADDSWLILSNFKKWFDLQPYKYFPEYVLDSVWLNCSRNRHFSPDTSAYVPYQLANFFAQPKLTYKNKMLGVDETASKTYHVDSAILKYREGVSSDELTQTFAVELDAHIQYLRFKSRSLDYICKNYELDERLFIVIDLVQDKLQCHIDNRIELKKLYDLFS